MRKRDWLLFNLLIKLELPFDLLGVLNSDVILPKT